MSKWRDQRRNRWRRRHRRKVTYQRLLPALREALRLNAIGIRRTVKYGPVQPYRCSMGERWYMTGETHWHNGHTPWRRILNPSKYQGSQLVMGRWDVDA